MNKYYLTVMSIYTCNHCGSEDVKLNGKTRDGRKIIKCNVCNRRSTCNKRKQGEAVFSVDKMIPVLLKPYSAINNGEMYSLGVIIADGSLCRNGQMSITLKKQDIDILKKVGQCLNIINPIHKVKYKSGIYIRLTWACKYSLRFWEYLGIVPNLKGNERWLSYMNNPHFVRGYMDGNGSITNIKDKLRVKIRCTSIEFIGSMRLYIRSIIKGMGDIKYEGVTYILIYENDEAKELLKILYMNSNDIRSERMYEIYNNCTK